MGGNINWMSSALQILRCYRCGEEYDPRKLNNLCVKCDGSLLAKYDTNKASKTFTKQSLKDRKGGLWRYFELLPLFDEKNLVSLGKGETPILSLNRLGERLGVPHLTVKNDGIMPTGTFKARRQTIALSKAKELALTDLSIPSAGNAAGAMSAYCARADIRAHVFMRVNSQNQIS